MLKYLIIQLDESSVSFCHYKNDVTKRSLIPLVTLKQAFFWSMKENLTVQILYPSYVLPEKYIETISQIDHADIVPLNCDDGKLRDRADVIVLDNWKHLKSHPFISRQSVVIRSTLEELFDNREKMETILKRATRINVVVTDIENFTFDEEKRYSELLDDFNEYIYQEYRNNHPVQLNFLTDRMALNEMNNCNAGVETITLMPNGKFYICPAFYFDGCDSCGDLEKGLNIKNPQLYKLSFAPICRICDAWHCKRCVWMNSKMTREVNTPSREQCVMAHIERNASRKLLEKIRTIGAFLPDKEIKELNYNDPFEKLINPEI